MVSRAQWIGCLASTLMASAVCAQDMAENSEHSTISNDAQKKEDASIMTTHKDAPAPDQLAAPDKATALPWLTKQDAAPDATVAKPAVSPFAKSPAKYQGGMPFGHVEVPKPVLTGPKSVSAAPVEGVDAVETSEPAPPTPVDPGANPTEESPEQPTELTSPIFKEETAPHSPRKIIIRALNKVTAQSQLIKFKPGDTVAFGQLRILGVTCQTSAPESLTDYAALLNISEEMPSGQSPKQLFRGWMYASSPSLASLENPVYDVTMVSCEILPPGSKDDADKPKEKQDAKAKEPAAPAAKPKDAAAKDKPAAPKKK